MFDNRDKAIPWGTDTVVIGCPVLANKAFLQGWMQKHWDKLSGKRVILFTTSGADPSKQPVMEWLEASLPEQIKQNTEIFPLAGSFDFSKLGFAHKLMMRIGAIVLRSDEIKHQIKNPVDNVRKENLTALLAALNE